MNTRMSSRSRSGSPGFRRWTIALLFLTTTGAASSQVSVPYEHGQWAGPYTLSLPDIYGYNYAEIAHAAVLPPAASNPSLERVIFIARRSYAAACEEDRPAEGWLWRADRPAGLRRITNTASPGNASGDPFCAGHTFLADGRFLVVGGLDMKNDHCDIDPDCTPGGTGTGHRWTYLLNTDVHPPTWDTTWMTSLNDATAMGRARWYPTAISLENGSISIWGHGANSEPGNNCAPIFNENAGQGNYKVLYDRTYEVLNVSGTPGFGPVSTSWLDKSHCNVQPENELIPMRAYPRMHLLATKDLIQANMWPRTLAMDRDPVTIACGDGRWEIMTSMSQEKRSGGNSVHLVYRVGQFNEPEDVLYALGGTTGDEEDPWSPGSSSSIWDSVEKLIVDDITMAVWEDAPSLKTARYNHNSIILLDGSILVNGGWDGAPMSAGNPPLLTERYRPPELFGITPGSGQDAWKEMTTAREPTHRRYHSVAGLLPDGRVFSAGGIEVNLQGTPSESRHTVNIYSPSYMFHARPEITAAPSVIEYLDPQEPEPFHVTFTLSTANSEFSRIGLIRNASVTHAWDSNQRYVVLNVVDEMRDGLEVTLEVMPPEDGFVAPPGYYLMSVVEENPVPYPPVLGGFEQKWLPSPGVWVRIDS